MVDISIQPQKVLLLEDGEYILLLEDISTSIDEIDLHGEWLDKTEGLTLKVATFELSPTIIMIKIIVCFSRTKKQPLEYAEARFSSPDMHFFGAYVRPTSHFSVPSWSSEA